MKMAIGSDEQMRQLGQKLGACLRGGETIELVGDVGAGKTTFTKGLALGLDIHEPIQSPTFTISRIYEARDGLEMRHYDFYRLQEAGIMSDELAEAFELPHSVVVVEWGGVVNGVLPADRLQVVLHARSETERDVEISAFGVRSGELMGALA